MSGINTLSESTKKRWMSYWGWSVSKQNLWDRCPKAYYYQYIHSWKLPREERNIFNKLKGLQTASLIHGTHISIILRRVLEGELSSDINSLKNVFEKEMRETFEKGEERITELYNGLGVSKEYFERHIKEGRKEIEYFITDIYPWIRNMEMKKIDKGDKYTMDGRTFYSVPDFLGVDQEEVWHLMDWKTGKGIETEESFLELQLTSYTYYAINYVAQSYIPDTMKLYVVFLQNPTKNIEKTLTERMLIYTKSRMFEMHDYLLEKSKKGPFPAYPEERKCIFCNFATICDDGKYFLGM